MNTPTKFLLTAVLSLGLAVSASAQITNHEWTGATDTRYALPGNWENDSNPPGTSTTAILNFNAANISNNMSLG